MPYPEMQKVGSFETNGGTMRSGSNSAPRSNVPYGGMGNYPPQQYYPNNPQYPGGVKMYDNRSQSPYQKPYQHNQPQGYQRNYQQQQGGTYYPPQGQGQSYGGYNQGGRQGGYQQPNRPYQQQYGYDYQQRGPQQPNYPQNQYPIQQQPYGYPNQ